MIRKVLITKENLELALDIQRKIFPDYDASQNYVDSISKNNKNNLKYYLLYSVDDCIGISGYYETDEDLHSGWLGWFGILPEYRRRGLGTKALELFFDECKQNGMSYARLYTDLENNYATIQFYLLNGMVGELYSNPNDDTNGIAVLVFSKSLNGDSIFRLWDNKNLHLQEQLKRQSTK